MTSAGGIGSPLERPQSHHSPSVGARAPWPWLEDKITFGVPDTTSLTYMWRLCHKARSGYAIPLALWAIEASGRQTRT